MFMLCLYFKAK